MNLLPFFQWCEATAIGHAIRDSQWLFPVVESFHLIALALIGGTVLIVDLRLLGLGLRQQSASRLALDARRWMLGSLGVMVITGVPLFLSESVKCYYSSAFWFKMTFLGLAVLFTFTVRNRVAAADQRVNPLIGKLVGLTSLALWFGVGAAGRWIGFQ